MFITLYLIAIELNTGLKGKITVFAPNWIGLRQVHFMYPKVLLSEGREPAWVPDVLEIRIELTPNI